MLLEQARICQEARDEGRQEMLRATVPLLLSNGMSVEQIAQRLNMDVENVQSAVQQND